MILLLKLIQELQFWFQVWTNLEVDGHDKFQIVKLLKMMGKESALDIE